MFAFKSLFIAALAVAGVSAAPSSKRQVNAACPNPEQEFKDDISCPSLQILGGVLSFQGDNVGATSKNVLGEVNNLLTTNQNPVTNIVADLTQGTVVGLINGVVSALKGFAATIPQLNPDCACNMVNCNSAIIDAQGQCNIGEAASGTEQACGQALYACAAFYTSEQIASMTDGCCAVRTPVEA